MVLAHKNTNLKMGKDCHLLLTLGFPSRKEQLLESAIKQINEL